MLDPDMVAIFCLVHGKPISNAFPIDIALNQTIGHLKQEIKKKKPNVFQDIDADELTLWMVSVSTSDKQIFQEFAQRASQESAVEEVLGGVKLDDPTTEIKDVFGDQPPKKHIHIIVKPPQPGKFTFTVDRSHFHFYLNRAAMYYVSLFHRR